MRDIRPQPMKARPTAPQPPESDLPSASSKPVARPRFTGSQVPVAKVHDSKQMVKKKELVPEVQPEGSQPKRPLFAKPPKPKKNSNHMRIGQKERLILASLFALILIAVVIAGLIFLPTAAISLTLQTAPLLVDDRLTLSSAPTDDSTIIPGAAFTREVTIEGASPVASREVVGTKASGTVEIVNRTTDEQKIREKSRLVTKDGQLFYMQTHVIVPAASGGVPSRATVTVEADLAGPQGNISSQRLNFAALDASAQSLVYAENTVALTGGTGEEVAIVKEADLTAARAAAGEMAKSQAEQEIRSELPNGWAILEESWSMEPKSFTTSVVVGNQTASIPFAAQILVRVMAYEDEKFQAALQNSLQAKLDQDFMLFPGPISYTKSVENVDWEKGEAIVPVRVTHTTIPNFSLDTLRDKLAGRAKEESLSYLQGLKGVKSASIELWPFWVKSIPTIEKRISIELHSDRE